MQRPCTCERAYIPVFASACEWHRRATPVPRGPGGIAHSSHVSPVRARPCLAPCTGPCRRPARARPALLRVYSDTWTAARMRCQLRRVVTGRPGSSARPPAARSSAGRVFSSAGDRQGESTRFGNGRRAGPVAQYRSAAPGRRRPPRRPSDDPAGGTREAPLQQDPPARVNRALGGTWPRRIRCCSLGPSVAAGARRLQLLGGVREDEPDSLGALVRLPARRRAAGTHPVLPAMSRMPWSRQPACRVLQAGLPELSQGLPLILACRRASWPRQPDWSQSRVRSLRLWRFNVRRTEACPPFPSKGTAACAC